MFVGIPCMYMARIRHIDFVYNSSNIMNEASYMPVVRVRITKKA